MNTKLINKFIEFENQDLIKDSGIKNKGTFILSGHFSNWELMAFAYPVIFDNRLNLIAKIQASKKLNEKINEYRELSGNEIIEIGFSLKEIFNKLKQNEIICFLIDQSAHPDYSAYINFFGKKVPSFSGPAKLALKQRPEIIIGFGTRRADYSYQINFEKINYDDLKDNINENVIELTQRIQTKFEEVIKNNPGQWLWFHKRFKHAKN